ncbi:MAG: deacetylase [Gammaproteobacteria bacterium 39-13]|nr:histone deacetylase family protein [Gammaproteobacteria bacterium]OJV89110.1 MAG: deacetylase [Gammaproteobacteria bacterium 39-13]
MPLTIFTHPDCLKHEMGINHPECPERLEVISQKLKQASIASQLEWKEAPLATKDQLKRVHDSAYIEFIFSQSPRQGYVPLDPDTIMNPFTLSAALRASGAQVAAVDEVFSAKTKRAFCLVRPPGHHAELHEAMGFSFFNNIAVGVAHAFAQYHCQRIAIVDFDVHHGNGTESIFLYEPRVCFWSSFQYPFYPGTVLTGKPSHIHLCPLAAGTRSDIFRQKVNLELLPILKDFKPECIFISAGFDAHQGDPLANLMLTEDDYRFITEQICEISDAFAKSRVISTLEGGYNLQVLGNSVLAHIEAMLS